MGLDVIEDHLLRTPIGLSVGIRHMDHLGFRVDLLHFRLVRRKGVSHLILRRRVLRRLNNVLGHLRGQDVGVNGLILTRGDCGS